jgi:peptide/nickel transport system substrate-binding protein
LYKRKAALSSAVVLAMTGLAASAGVAGAAAPTKGGTMKIALQSDTDFTDPALDYYQLGWEIEYSTCVKLLNYPDAAGAEGSKLVPEAAAALPTVSNSGKTYTFTVPKKYQFSPPSNQFVTAKTFQFVINRLANPKMQSPAVPFLADIAGAQAVIDGKAKSVSGVKVSGNKIKITLTGAHPDFLARIAMPFFCALPTNTPIDPQGVNTPAGAGPYYIKSRTPKRQIVLQRNPNYHGNRPANLDKIIYTVGIAPDAALLQTKAGQVDWGADEFYPSEYAALWNQYGPTSKLGKSGKQQFYVNPLLSVQYLAMNTSRGVFQNNTKLRQAVNFAVDRPTILRQSGAYAGKVTDQVLPPGVAGYQDINLYPLQGPNVAKAKSLAGSISNPEITLYTSTRPQATAAAQVYQQNLAAIGFKVNVQQFARATQIQKEGTKGEPFDLTTEGWNADYADPFDFINVLLSGDSIHDNNNNNVAYFNVPSVNQAMTKAALQTGDKRAAAYANLDKSIMQNYAPWAPIDNATERDFFSARMGGVLFHPIYTVDLGALFIRK